LKFWALNAPFNAECCTCFVHRYFPWKIDKKKEKKDYRVQVNQFMIISAEIEIASSARRYYVNDVV
jgi:hypothetical protein